MHWSWEALQPGSRNDSWRATSIELPWTCTVTAKQCSTAPCLSKAWATSTTQSPVRPPVRSRTTVTCMAKNNSWWKNCWWFSVVADFASPRIMILPCKMASLSAFSFSNLFDSRLRSRLPLHFGRQIVTINAKSFSQWLSSFLNYPDFSFAPCLIKNHLGTTVPVV